MSELTPAILEKAATHFIRDLAPNPEQLEGTGVLLIGDQEQPDNPDVTARRAFLTTIQARLAEEFLTTPITRVDFPLSPEDKQYAPGVLNALSQFPSQLPLTAVYLAKVWPNRTQLYDVLNEQAKQRPGSALAINLGMTAGDIAFATLITDDVRSQAIKKAKELSGWFNDPNHKKGWFEVVTHRKGKDMNLFVPFDLTQAPLEIDWGQLRFDTPMPHDKFTTAGNVVGLGEEFLPPFPIDNAHGRSFVHGGRIAVMNGILTEIRGNITRETRAHTIDQYLTELGIPFGSWGNLFKGYQGLSTIHLEKKAIHLGTTRPVSETPEAAKILARAGDMAHHDFLTPPVSQLYFRASPKSVRELVIDTSR